MKAKSCRLLECSWTSIFTRSSRKVLKKNSPLQSDCKNGAVKKQPNFFLLHLYSNTEVIVDPFKIDEKVSIFVSLSGFFRSSRPQKKDAAVVQPGQQFQSRQKKRFYPIAPPGSAPSLISPCSPICCDTFPRKKGRDKGGEVVPFVGICEPPVPKCLRRGLMGSRCKYTLSWDRLWVGFPGDQFWGFIQVLWRDSVEGELDWFSPEGVQPRYPFSIPAPPVGH